MAIIKKTFTNPQNLLQADKNTLSAVIQSISDSMMRVDGETSYQKEAIESIADKLDLDKKLVKKMARLFHKMSFDEAVDQHRALEEAYTSVLLKKDAQNG